MKPLTDKQQNIMDRLPEEGPIHCRGSQYEFLKSAQPLSKAVVNNLVKAGHLMGGGDGLFPDSPPQTLHAAH